MHVACHVYVENIKFVKTTESKHAALVVRRTKRTIFKNSFDE